MHEETGWIQARRPKRGIDGLDCVNENGKPIYSGRDPKHNSGFYPVLVRTDNGLRRQFFYYGVGWPSHRVEYWFDLPENPE
jgi:hypothetical protein